MLPFSRPNGATSKDREQGSSMTIPRFSLDTRNPRDAPASGAGYRHILSEASSTSFSVPGIPAFTSMQSNLATSISGILQDERTRNGPSASAFLMDQASHRHNDDTVRGLLLKLKSAGCRAGDANSLVSATRPATSAITSMDPENPDNTMAASLLRQLVVIDQRQQLLKQLITGCLPAASQGLQLLQAYGAGESYLCSDSRLPIRSLTTLEADRQRFLLENLIARNISYQASRATFPLAELGRSDTVESGTPSTTGYLLDSQNQTSALQDSRLPYMQGTFEDPSFSGSQISSAASMHSGNLKNRNGTVKTRKEQLLDARDVPTQKTFPSERASLDLNNDCDSPRHVGRVLSLLGSTLRSKADPFIDVSTLPPPPVAEEKRVVRGTDVFFPDTLYRMLEDAEREGLDDVIAFLPHGRAFRVSNKELFVDKILPRYFSEQTKWSSFSRQLRLYGFLRISKGIDFGTSRLFFYSLRWTCLTR